MVQATVREAGCSGLRTPASWCRAQGRAQAASGAGLRHGHGKTDGRVHLAWHRSDAPAEWHPQRRSLNPSAGRDLQLPPAVSVIGAGQIPFWPITFGFCFSVNRAALQVGTRAARPRPCERADWFGSSSVADLAGVMQRRGRFPQHPHAARARRIASGCGHWERAWNHRGHPPSPREALNDPDSASPAVQPVHFAESLASKAVASAGHAQKERSGRHKL